MNERMICADGIELAAEAFGHLDSPAGASDSGRAMSSMPWRSEEFWEWIESRTLDDMDEIYGLAVRGSRVVRFALPKYQRASGPTYD